METLKLGDKLQTREPQVLLDPTLKPGKYRVTLSIVGTTGESEPVELRIAIVERTDTRPTVPVPNPPVVVVRGLERVATPAVAVTRSAATTKAKTTTKAKAKAKAKTPAATPGKPPTKPKRK
ncbi:MAG TPA: hypothetical protein VMF52_16465 [Steroidobacteraceae bacterium]|nr:hypothetical protein [Steroidobacteraceae bacterium]